MKIGTRALVWVGNRRRNFGFSIAAGTPPTAGWSCGLGGVSVSVLRAAFIVFPTALLISLFGGIESQSMLEAEEAEEGEEEGEEGRGERVVVGEFLTLLLLLLSPMLFPLLKAGNGPSTNGNGMFSYS